MAHHPQKELQGGLLHPPLTVWGASLLPSELPAFLALCECMTYPHAPQAGVTSPPASQCTRGSLALAYTTASLEHNYFFSWIIQARRLPSPF